MKMSGATTSSSVDREAGQYKSVRCEKSELVAKVILTGPGKGNAMGPDFWREMPDLFAELDQDDEVRAVVISGDGNNFSYGLDIPAMMSQPGFKVVGPNLAAERTDFLDMALQMQKAINCVASCRKPVIAAVHGWCIGAGLDLISACDIRLASSDAKFSLREVKVAIVSDMGSLQRLPYVIGEAHTRDLALSGRDIDATYAEKIGLVIEVLQSPEMLFQGAQQRAQEIAANPPLVVQGIKRVMNHSRDQLIESGLKFVTLWNSAFLQSNDLAEAMIAFQQKRPPKFKGN
jgi:enoyl-CoA hydratase